MTLERVKELLARSAEKIQEETDRYHTALVSIRKSLDVHMGLVTKLYSHKSAAVRGSKRTTELAQVGIPNMYPSALAHASCQGVIVTPSASGRTSVPTSQAVLFAGSTFNTLRTSLLW